MITRGRNKEREIKRRGMIYVFHFIWVKDDDDCRSHSCEKVNSVDYNSVDYNSADCNSVDHKFD